MTPSQTRRRSGPKPRLSYDEVIEAALQIADQDGLASLTMQRIADQLDVGVMTLYGYVRTKEEIFDGIGAKVFSALVIDRDSSAPWDEQLTDALGSIRDTVHEHPGALELILTAHSLSGPAADGLADLLIAPLREAGFDESLAIDIIGTLTSYTVGFLAVESARSPLAADAGSIRHMSERTFEKGLSHLLTGFGEELEGTPQGS